MSLRIVHVTPEFAPLIKVGGLGDVVGSLAMETARNGHTVEVVLPFYDTLSQDKLETIHAVERTVITQEGRTGIPWRLYSAQFHGVRLTLLHPEHHKRYFSRGAVFGQSDDNERFILFSCAAAAYLNERSDIDIVHLHDWQTALVAPLITNKHARVFTIHNAHFQGRCSRDNLHKVHLSELLPKLAMPDIDDPFLLKGAVEYADCITTVSPSYAREIQTTDKGAGFQALYYKHRHKIEGILNGIDLSYWNPKTDPYLFENYALDNLTAKQRNKSALFQSMHKMPPQSALFCAITRLTAQKGPVLIQKGLEYVLKKGSAFALSGSPSPDTKRDFDALYAGWHTCPFALFNFCFDEPLAHRIFAAADFILIPSHFEPCGLTQMIALCYGTLPIVTHTGGLADTIVDIADRRQGNGIVLQDREEETLYDAIDRALALSDADKQAIFTRFDPSIFSWKQSLEKYLSVYRRAKKA